MRTYLRTATIAVASAALFAGGGVAWAVTAQPTSTPAPSKSMMDGGMSMMMGSTGAMASAGAMGSASADAPFDLQFIDRMTMHHQGALMSTRAMIADSDRPELRALAAAIETSQTAQIDQMGTWREQWYGAADPAAGMDEAQMQQMMPEGAMTGMAGMMGAGAQGETMYLQMMIVHHQQGVDMAKEAIARSQRPEVRQLAEQIAAEQSAQIVLMQGYLTQR